MQNLFHDGGFSNMGMSLKAMTMYNKSFNCDCDPEEDLAELD
jgi:enoyl-[acyl-carrier protein] reductase I